MRQPQHKCISPDQFNTKDVNNVVYSFEINTPANTPQALPLKTVLPISKGIVRQWYVEFPEGNFYETPLRLKKGGDAILPMNSGSQMKGNGKPFISEEFLSIDTPPWELQAYTWNIDLNNDHMIYIAITIMPLWTLLPYSNQLMDLLTREEIKMVF